MNRAEQTQEAKAIRARFAEIQARRLAYRWTAERLAAITVPDYSTRGAWMNDAKERAA